MAAAIQNRVLEKEPVGEGRGERFQQKTNKVGQWGRQNRTAQREGGWERRERNNGRGGRERVKSSKQARKGLNT